MTQFAPLFLSKFSKFSKSTVFSETDSPATVAHAARIIGAIAAVNRFEIFMHKQPKTALGGGNQKKVQNA